MEFPRKRFERVGATLHELDEMEAEFVASAEAAQRSLVDRLAPLADAAVSALLDERRESKATAAPEPAAAQPAAAAAPASSQGTAAKASQSSGDSGQQSS